MQSNIGAAHFSFSSLGSLLYIPGGIGGTERTLVWVDRQGAVEPLAAPPRRYNAPRLSPDGQRLAVEILGANLDVWIYDIPRGTLTRLTFEANNQLPIWAPDGKRLAFASDRAGPANLFWKLADGSGAAERLATSEHGNHPDSWSSDGQALAFHEHHPTTGRDVWVLPLEGERQPRPFLRTPFNEASPVFSPDNRWLAYGSGESGRREIYVQPFPGPGGKSQISTEGGTEPVWPRNGRELFYRNGERMMAVEITTEPTFSAGSPRLLFEGRQFSFSAGFGANYDVTSDGQRFVMMQASEQQQEAATQINVVLNWFEELKRRVPTGN